MGTGSSFFGRKASGKWRYTSTSPSAFMAFTRTTLLLLRNDSWLPFPKNQNEALQDMVSHQHYQSPARGQGGLLRVSICRLKFPLSNVLLLFCLRRWWRQEWGRRPGNPCRRQTVIQDPQHWPTGNIMMALSRLWSGISNKPVIYRLLCLWSNSSSDFFQNLYDHLCFRLIWMQH